MRPTRSAYGYSSHPNPLPNWREFLSKEEREEVRRIDFDGGLQKHSPRRDQLLAKAWPLRRAAIEAGA